MDVWLIYRLFRNQDNTKIEKIEPIEYVNNEADARKYQRLFDLQVPVDLKNKIFHKYQSSFMQDYE